jgi:hypothetical protein
MDLPLLLMMIALFQEALPGLSPEDSEVVRHLELLENLELAESMELFVAPVEEPDAGLPEAPESAP